MTTLMCLVMGVLTGFTVYTAFTERDRRAAFWLWVTAAGLALLTLGVAFIPVLPYLIH